MPPSMVSLVVLVDQNDDSGKDAEAPSFRGALNLHGNQRLNRHGHQNRILGSREGVGGIHLATSSHLHGVCHGWLRVLVFLPSGRHLSGFGAPVRSRIAQH